MARVPLRLLYAGLLLQSAAALEPSEQKPIIEGVENVEDVAQSGPGGTPGKIVLYPGSRTFPSDLKAMNMEVKACPRGSSPKTIELSPDVCLSGEYYVQNNMKFVETPKCADGTEASMMFYPNRGCTGTPRFSSSETPFAMGDCLWSEEQNPVPSYYWSIIYRCNAETDEGVSHETAEPPLLVGEIIGPLKAKASFHNGPPFQCHTDFANKSHAWEYSPDGCNWPLSSWPREALEIRTPAICPNGTRAQLAIYEDFGKNWRNYKCIESKRVPHTRRIDIDDSMINTCIDIKHKTYPNRAIGVQFYCNGLEYENGVGKPIIPEKEPPVPKAGMVSHNVCATSAGRWQWNAAEGHPTFFYPKAETCIKLPKSHQVKPYKNAICPDGSAARFTEWSNADCSGWPASIEGVDASMFLNCQNWNLAGESSYMFWCGTNGTEPSEKSSDDHRAVVTRNGCPKEEKDKGWVGRKDEVGPTYERIEPDTCVNLGKSSRWLVFSGATCKDGSTAKVALWKRNACFGKPDSITRFEESGIGECKQTCPDDSWSCSMAFWCEGIERDGIF